MNNTRAYVKLSKAKKQSLNRIFAIRKVKNQKKWTREEDELLISLAEKYNEKHWKEISKMFVNKNSLQCFSRYKRIRPGIIKGSWKKEEDQEILRLVNKYGKAWSKISKMLNTRNGKQIRDRFINVLDPEIKKGKFTEEEDKKLISLFQQFGPKWATISKYYPNRTADMIKNRFHSSIKKKLFGDQNIKTDMTFSNVRIKAHFLFLKILQHVSISILILFFLCSFDFKFFFVAFLNLIY
jgi:hypothetical protein